MKKRFIVEIDIPENSGDLCWDEDQTGLQAFHDCVVSVLPEVSLKWTLIAAQDDSKYNKEFSAFIEKQNNVRKSFKVIEALQTTKGEQ
jgi:hypothetical protein